MLLIDPPGKRKGLTPPRLSSRGDLACIKTLTTLGMRRLSSRLFKAIPMHLAPLSDGYASSSRLWGANANRCYRPPRELAQTGAHMLTPKLGMVPHGIQGASNKQVQKASCLGFKMVMVESATTNFGLILK